MARFMPGARISQAHGTVRPVDPATGARDAMVYAMYHPAAALRTPAIETESYADMAGVPIALLESRRRREANRAAIDASPAEPEPLQEPVMRATLPAADPVEPTAPVPPPAPVAAPAPAAPTDRPVDAADTATPQLTLF